MSRISITPDAAQVFGALLDRYESAGHTCFVLGHEDTCDGDIKRCVQCKHFKSFQKLKADLFKAGEP